MHHLSIDLETYCEASIRDTGSYRYIADDSFQIMLFAYSVDWGEVHVVDRTMGFEVPGSVMELLKNPNYIKHAYNAPFEMSSIAKIYGDGYIDPDQWQDTMIHGLYCGYTAGLDLTGAVLGLPQEKQKLKTGKDLIRYFCGPCKPTKSNGGRTRNMPWDNPEKWKMFVDYNRQDVVTEMEIEKRLSTYPVPEFVWQQWRTDYRINRRGVGVDMKLVDGALSIAATENELLNEEAKRITKLENPNSVTQLKTWLSQNGSEVADLQKATVANELQNGDLSDDVRRVYEIRQMLGKTSTKKYTAVKTCVCADDRVRGILQFYGANRTGRYAGRLVQMQNLPRTYLKREIQPFARELVERKKIDALHMCFGNVNDTLSQLIRTAFVPRKGNVFIDADFSAIEARVISWLAGENWRLDVFRTHGKIYEASASQMFGVPIELIKKGNPEYALRAKGKVAELALGYGGSTSALIAMGALDMGLSEEELPDIVTMWRNANPSIKNLWYAVNNAALYVIRNGGRVKVKCIELAKEFDTNLQKECMTISLPSGRKLFYIDPAIGENRFGGESILFMGVNQTSKRWEQVETYGAKLVENIVQAISRDCLAVAIERLEDRGYPIVFHIHDEVVIDIKPYADRETMLNDVIRIMSEVPTWAEGLPLNADGWVGDFFTKD